MKFILKNLHCDSCVHVAQMQIKKLAGVSDVQIVRRGQEADGKLEAERDISITEIQDSLAGTHYEVLPA